jgi:hypothetical protein
MAARPGVTAAGAAAAGAAAVMVAAVGELITLEY